MVELPARYPPDSHMLRDLRLWIERGDAGARAGFDVVPELCGPDGSLRTGVLGVLADVAAGELAVRSARPQWVATSDLVLHVLRPPTEARVEARPRLLRQTRSTLVIEVDISDGGTPVALATTSFALLPAKTSVQRVGVGADEPRTEFALPGSRMAEPFPRALGARLLDAGAGVFELPLSTYVVNSLGALQGGAVCGLVDLAAEAAAGAALGAACATRDLALNFLALGREGPIRSSARLLRRSREDALVRVELQDSGGRLLTVATAVAVRLAAAGAAREAP